MVLFIELMGEKLEVVIGHMDVEMDGHYKNMRTKETNLGILYSCSFRISVILIQTFSNYKDIKLIFYLQSVHIRIPSIP